MSAQRRCAALLAHGMCRALKVCMHDLKTVRSWRWLAVPLLATAALSACVVVPVDPKTGHPYGQAPQPQVVVVQPPVPATASAQPAAAPLWTTVSTRLYPVNDVARNSGLLQATVIDAGTGRGSFSVNYQAQTLQGEATRVDRNYPGFGSILQLVQGGSTSGWAQAAGQRGIANAANASHSMRCEYLFTAPGQGTGACVVSDGARYQIHFGG
jgi:hypothetical protein